jgi:hypothetical protein
MESTRNEPLRACVRCRHCDRATIYTARGPSYFYPSSVRQLFALHARLHCSLVRPFHIVPGYVPYSRLQALTIVVVALEVNAVCALLFGGVDQCSQVRALTAALISMCVSSVMTFVGRHAFKSATRGGEGGRSIKLHKYRR